MTTQVVALAGVQTKCACGHSAAAHDRLGRCEGIDFFTRGPNGGGLPGLELCECPDLHDTYTVPAGGA